MSDFDAMRARHVGPHSCFGLDPIMGAGYRLFGSDDGVLCDFIQADDARRRVVEAAAAALYDAIVAELVVLWGEPSDVVSSQVRPQVAEAIAEHYRAALAEPES